MLEAFPPPPAASLVADCKHNAFIRVVWLTACGHRYEGADAVDADAVSHAPGFTGDLYNGPRDRASNRPGSGSEYRSVRHAS